MLNSVENCIVLTYLRLWTEFWISPKRLSTLFDFLFDFPAILYYFNKYPSCQAIFIVFNSSILLSCSLCHCLFNIYSILCVCPFSLQTPGTSTYSICGTWRENVAIMPQRDSMMRFCFSVPPGWGSSSSSQSTSVSAPCLQRSSSSWRGSCLCM